MDLAGRVALVTGAQQGIGAAIAREFAKAGADVAINWLDDETAARQVADAVRAAGRRALLYQADVARLDATREMVASVERDLGPIDVLVNNAGVFPRVAFLDMEESDWDYVLDVNLKGAAFCAQAAARAMVASGRHGSIINLTSGAAYRGSPRGVHYCASKGGVLVDDKADGAGAGAASDQGQRDRARSDRHRAAALWQQRGGADGDGKRAAARASGNAGRYRRRRRFSGVRRGRVRHRALPARQWRRVSRLTGEPGMTPNAGGVRKSRNPQLGRVRFILIKRVAREYAGRFMEDALLRAVDNTIRFQRLAAFELRRLLERAPDISPPNFIMSPINSKPMPPTSIAHPSCRGNSFLPNQARDDARPICRCVGCRYA